jgi:hypothetical protein
MHPVFEKLHPAIQRALAKHNFTEPTASRIIRKLRVSEDEFYADIFESERNYVQTLRFRD